MPNQIINREQNSMISDTYSQLPETRNKPAITIHTFMAILTVMFVVALLLVLGLDYFFNLPQLHSQSMFDGCLPPASQGFCLILKG